MDRDLTSHTDLRRKMAAKCRDLPEQTRRDLSTAICRMLDRTGLPDQAEAVFGYMALETEPDIWPALETLLAKGKTVALPKCLSDTTMAFYKITSAGDLARGRFGILEPVHTAPEFCVRPDEHTLVIVPGMAYDKRGYRLGHGQGYYDRYLAEHPLRAAAVMTAYSFQKTEDLPARPHDVPMDHIITEEGIVTV